MSRRPRVLIVDLDGTLLPDDKVIPEAVREAIHAFRYGGGSVLVATARRVATALPYVQALKADLPLVAENGAQIVTPEGSPLRRKRFPRSVWHHILSRNIPFVATIEGENYIWEGGHAWEEYRPYPGTHLLRDPREVQDLPPPTRLVVPQEVSLPPGPYRKYAQPDGTLHLAPEGVSKREGVLWVLRVHGFSPHHALFMGDGGVDFPLLLEIPWGVVPRSALEGLAHYARWEMAPPGRHGAAFFLRRMGWSWKSP